MTISKRDGWLNYATKPITLGCCDPKPPTSNQANLSSPAYCCFAMASCS